MKAIKRFARWLGSGIGPHYWIAMYDLGREAITNVVFAILSAMRHRFVWLYPLASLAHAVIMTFVKHESDLETVRRETRIRKHECSDKSVNS